MDTAESHAGHGRRRETDGIGRRRQASHRRDLRRARLRHERRSSRQALEVQREKGGRIGEILVAQGSLSRLDLASALAEHWEPHRFLLAPSGRSRGGGDAGGTLRRMTRRSPSSRSGCARPSSGSAPSRARRRAVRASWGGGRTSPTCRTVSPTSSSSSAASPGSITGSARSSRGSTSSTRFASPTRSHGSADRERRVGTREAARRGSRTGRAPSSALEEGLDALDLRPKAFEATAMSRAAELADASGPRGRHGALREELASFRQVIDERGRGAERATSSLKLETGSLGARIDELRAYAPATPRSSAGRPSSSPHAWTISPARLDAREATHEEHVAATERALRDGDSRLRAMVEALEGARARAEGEEEGQERSEHDEPD